VKWRWHLRLVKLHLPVVSWLARPTLYTEVVKETPKKPEEKPKTAPAKVEPKPRYETRRRGWKHAKGFKLGGRTGPANRKVRTVKLPLPMPKVLLILLTVALPALFLHMGHQYVSTLYGLPSPGAFSLLAFFRSNKRCALCKGPVSITQDSNSLTVVKGKSLRFCSKSHEEIFSDKNKKAEFDAIQRQTRRDFVKVTAGVAGAGVLAGLLGGIGIGRSEAASGGSGDPEVISSGPGGQVGTASVIVFQDSSDNAYVIDRGAGLSSTNGLVGALLVNANVTTTYYNTLTGDAAGATTQTAGIQEAMNSVVSSGGGTVFFKRGIYDISNASQVSKDTTGIVSQLYVPVVSNTGLEGFQVPLFLVGESYGNVIPGFTINGTISGGTIIYSKVSADNLMFYCPQGSNSLKLNSVYLYMDNLAFVTNTTDATTNINANGINISYAVSVELGTVLVQSIVDTIAYSKNNIGTGMQIGEDSVSPGPKAKLLMIYGWISGTGLNACFTHWQIDYLAIDFCYAGVITQTAAYAGHISFYQYNNVAYAFNVNGKTHLVVDLMEFGDETTTGTDAFVADVEIQSGVLCLLTAKWSSVNTTAPVVTQVGTAATGTHVVLQPLLPLGASAITVGASPFTYTNSDPYPENVVISGGTLSAVALQRGATSSNSVAGDQIVYLAQGDAVIVTYTSAPTMEKFPL
jgi:hypothetical protein